MSVLKNRKDIYIYPAVFYYEEDQISVLFPDFPGCATQGDNEEEALKNAKEALSGHILMMEQDNDPIPEPTSIFKVQPDNDCLSRIILIEVYMVGLREAWETKSVNRMVTLPRWLDRIASEQSVNFSQTLQEALKQKIRV